MGEAAFASPATGWAHVGDPETAQCQVLFTDDAGETWTPQLVWHGQIHPGLAAFDERQAALGLSVSQGEDINGYRPEPRACGDPFIGPELFLASTADAGCRCRPGRSSPGWTRSRTECSGSPRARSRPW